METSLKTILAASTTFTSSLGLRAIWSTENTQGQPATLGREAEEILNSNFQSLEAEVKSKAPETAQIGGVSLTVVRTPDGKIPIVQILGDDPSKTISQKVISSFYDRMPSANFFNPETAVIGYYSTADGKTLISSTNHRTSDFISVTPSKMYIGGDINKKLAGNVYFYDENYNFISFITSPATIPANCRFIKVTFNLTVVDINTCMIIQGSVLPNVFIPYQTVILRPELLPTIPAENMPSDIDIVGSKVTDTPFLTMQNTVNLFNKDTVTSGHYGENGVTHVNSSQHVTSDFIEIIPLVPYIKGTAGALSSAYNYFFDDAKKLIGYSGAISNPIPVENAKFMRSVFNITLTPVADIMIVQGSVLPSQYIPFKTLLINSKFLPTSVSAKLFTKYVAVGTSITWGYAPRNITLLIPSINAGTQIKSYAQLTGEAIAGSFINYGISSSTVARIASNPSINNPMCGRISVLPDDADLITIEGGTNDLRQGIPVGTMSDRVETTFYGALHSICAQLFTKYFTNKVLNGKPKAKVVLCTPIKLLKDVQNGYLDTGLETYCQAIKDVAAYYSLPVLDLYNLSEINPHLDKTLQGTHPDSPYLYNKYITDGVHPTPEGHEIIKDVVIGFLKTLK